MNLRIGCLIVLLAGAPALATVRVALVATGDNEKINQAISLATAQLGPDKDLELVDRQSIDSILAEQKLNLSGMIESDGMIKVGKLLKADLFAVVETDPGDGKALGLVIFDPNTSVRLSDAAMQGSSEQAASAIADAIRAAAAKDKSLGQGVRLVGFLPVRNADLPADRDIFCETVRLLVERQLTASPQIAVLERNRLEHVNKERQLPTSQSGGDLATSVVVVQLEISRKGQGLKGTAILTGASGQTLDKLEAEVDADSAADLAEKLRDRLIQSLKAQPIDQPFDRGEEARRFARDSDVLAHNARFTAAATAGEAAFALQPNRANRLYLSTALWMRAWEYLTPHDVNLVEMTTGWVDAINPSTDDFDHAVAIASRALQLQQEALAARLADPNQSDDYMEEMGGELRIDLLSGFCARLNGVQKVTADSEPRVAEFRSAALTYLLEYFDGWGKSIDAHPADLTNYDAEILYALSCDATIADRFADYANARNQLIHRWIASFDQSSSKVRDLWMQAGLRQAELMSELLNPDSMNSIRWKDYGDGVLQKSLGPIADDLNHSSSEVIRMYGAIATVLADPQPSAVTPEAKDKAFKSLLGQLEGVLDKPGKFPRRACMYAYIAAVSGIELLPPGTRSASDEVVDLLDIALQRKQLLPEVALKLILDGTVNLSFTAPPRDLLVALEKTLELSRSPDCHVLDGNGDGVRQELMSEIHDLHKQFPELGDEKLSRPWDSATLLADLSSLPGISRIEEHAQVSADHVFFAGSGTDAGKFFLQAFDVPLAGGSVKSMARISVTPLPGVDGGIDLDPDGFLYRLVQGSAVDDDNFYVSVRGQGVIVFPRDGGPAVKIDSTNGLPSDWARSMVAVGGNLFIACSDKASAYLVRWKPHDKSLHIRISSLRKEKKSPLDDTPGLRIEFMANDAPRNRLLLGVAEYAPSASNNWDDCRGGLWQLDLKNGKMNHLLTAASGLDYGQFRGIDDDSLFAATTLWVIKYDLKQNHGEYLSFKTGTISESYIREVELKKETMKGTGWAQPDSVQPGERRVVNNWLWTGQPFSRISADAKTVELLDGRLAAGKPPIDPVWTIEPASANRLVLGDEHQLYVVTLSEGK